MGDNEVNMLLSVMQNGFKDLKSDIKDSREERQRQVTAIHERINTIDRETVRRDEHARDLASLRQEVLLHTNKSPDSNSGYGNGGNGKSWLGTINTPKGWRITGLSAAIVALAIAWIVMHGAKIL